MNRTHGHSHPLHRSPKLRRPLLLLAGLTLLWLPAVVAGTVETHFAWADGKPRLEIVATPDPTAAPVAAGDITAPVHIFDAKGALVWETAFPLRVPAGKSWKGELPLEAVREFNQQYRVEVAVVDNPRGLDYRETLYFAKPTDSLWSYGLRRQGVFPDHKVYFTAAVKDFKGVEAREIPVRVGVFDADENSVLDVVRSIAPALQPSWHAIDITPPAARKLLGPFRADISLESDPFAMFLNTSLKFPYPNALAPVTSFEHGDTSLWFAAAAEPPRPEHTLQMYYTPQLTELRPRDYPAVRFDTAENHGGRQSLRLEYRPGDRVHVFSRQFLPGKPSALVVWVKGNNSADQLWVTFEDFINLMLPAWQRNANFDTARVCTLDFTGWRRFRVPVLGDGMQQTGLKGSSPNIDSPVAINSFSILGAPRTPPAKPDERTAIWLDDIAVETQAPPTDLVTLELALPNVDGQLTPDGAVHAAVGNGFAAELRQGRFTLTARDGRGEVIHTAVQEVRVPAQGWAAAELPLAPVAARKPRGPISIEVVFADASMVGARAVRHLMLKSADQSGICFDFEDPASYSGIGIVQRQPHEAPHIEVGAPVAAIVDGGAEGSAHALSLPVKLEAPANGVLLHPALPGVTDRIELWVKGDGRPTRLQVWFIDSGNTGVWLRHFNMFWPAPIVVDWTDWRRVTVQAPPIPPSYGDKNAWFFAQPWYPLNLALKVERPPDVKEPGQIWIDGIRTVTHLPETEEWTCDVLYPDDTCVHTPASPLRLVCRNFGPAPRTIKIPWRLRNYQGFDALSGTLTATLPAGARQNLDLAPKLPPGIYDLILEGIGSAPVVRQISVLEARTFLAAEPRPLFTDPVKLRQLLGLLTERIYLDWDNTEPMPNSFHFDWFAKEMGQRQGGGLFRVVPVVGFSADWAGPEAAEAIQKETYGRYIPNLYQVPARMVDWSRFVRECVREYHARFDEWAFWENPDIDGAPQFIPPAKYGEMLGILHRWVKLYAPSARVTAGGFNFQRIFGYLDQIKNPAALAFDDISVQMNIGELSPEAVDLEGFLDDLEQVLHLRETNRRVQTTELDWGIGPFVSPLQQAAYHSRAAMILRSRGAVPHQFSLANGGFEFDGYGCFHRLPYGNTANLQLLQPVYVPKPSFFAHVFIQRFLRDWQFVTSVLPADRSLDANRVFIFRDAGGRFAAVSWRVAPGERLYRLPASWAQATATDAFGFPARTDAGLRLTALPTFLQFPAGAALPQIVHEARHLEAADGTFPVIAQIEVTEPDAATRAAYKATGELRTETRSGVIPGAFKVRQPFLVGVTGETFTFRAPAAGNVLLRHRWYNDGSGQKLQVSLNEQPALAWDLSPGQGNDAGIRESACVLHGALAGENRVTVRYERPGTSALYRLEPLRNDYVELTRWGVLNTRQTQGEIQSFKSAVGTPLRLGKQDYDDGIGAHAVSFMEIPLDGQFRAFEVTTGIDSQTEGRGSVVFRIFVDGKERATSGTMNGFTAAKTLKLDDLGGARRLVLSVMDAGDGNKNDLADWVNGKLYLK